MLIDAHQHCWRPERGDYGWLSPASPLYRTYLPSDYATASAGSGIDATILVQAAPTEAETEFLLALARAGGSTIAGVVGWVDLEAADVPDRIARLATDPLLLGVRPMLQDLADRRWILRPEVARGLAALVAHDLAFDALVNADQIAVVSELADRYPDLRIVLDHAAKPPLGTNLYRWRDEVAALAARDNVTCKLSGLLTQLPEGGSIALLEPALDTIFDWFGPKQLIWGSDWPVVTLAAPLGDWLTLCRDAVAARAASHAKAIFGGNACRVYRLPHHSTI